jgi:hypothetical protein
MISPLVPVGGWLAFPPLLAKEPLKEAGSAYTGGPQTSEHWWVLGSQTPPKQFFVPQSTDTPHADPLPHCQSTLHTGTWQQKFMKQPYPLGQGQSCGQLVQFSPCTQTPSPHLAWQVPFWQGNPVVQVPQLWPQLPVPHVAPLQLGTQQVPAVWSQMPPHRQSPGHVAQFSPPEQTPSPQLTLATHWPVALQLWPVGHIPQLPLQPSGPHCLPLHALVQHALL